MSDPISAGNTSDRYGWVAMLLHWAVVALIVVQLVLANMADAADTDLEELALLARHKSFGITIAMLAVLRILWRLAQPTPSLPPRMPAWERRAARATHWGFYVLLFALPLSGWTMSSAAEFSVSWFGVFELPDPVGGDEALAETFHEVHEILATALLVLAGVHILAALKHHFFDRDDVLRRMLPVGLRGRDG